MTYPFRLGLIILALCTAVANAGWLEPVDEPRPAPALKLPDMQDTPGSLADHRGKVVLVNFWASWCPPCLVEMPGMQRLAKALGGKPFVILAVNVGESKHKAHKAMSMLNFTQPVLLDRDGEVAKAWRVGVYPTSFVVDRAGRVRYQVLGPLAWDSGEAQAVIEGLIEESAPPDAAAQPRPVVLGLNHLNRWTNALK
jgi:thiol-disulfide isomerase/thioredoxin